MFANTWHYADKQNVFFTLFLGYLAFCALEYFWETPAAFSLCLLSSVSLSYSMQITAGVVSSFSFLMYLLRNEKGIPGDRRNAAG